MRIVILLTTISFALSGVALAAPCKDAKGKFIKCPPPVAAKAAPCKDSKGKFVKCPPPSSKCKDGNGRFAKCGTPGAKPA